MYELYASDIRMFDVLAEVHGDQMPENTVVTLVDQSDYGWVWLKTNNGKWFRLTPYEPVQVW